MQLTLDNVHQIPVEIRVLDILRHGVTKLGLYQTVMSTLFEFSPCGFSCDKLAVHHKKKSTRGAAGKHTRKAASSI